MCVHDQPTLAVWCNEDNKVIVVLGQKTWDTDGSSVAGNLEYYYIAVCISCYHITMATNFNFMPFGYLPWAVYIVTCTGLATKYMCYIILIS